MGTAAAAAAAKQMAARIRAKKPASRDVAASARASEPHTHTCSVLSVLQPSSIRGLATPWTYFLHSSLSSVILIDSSTESPAVHVLMLSYTHRSCIIHRPPGVYTLDALGGAAAAAAICNDD